MRDGIRTRGRQGHNLELYQLSYPHHVLSADAVAPLPRKRRVRIARRRDERHGGREAAREHREQADTRDRKAQQARLTAEEQEDRARKEQTAAEEHRQQAQEIDPDVEE